MFVHDDGTPMECPEIVAALLVEEHGRTPENAARLLRLFPDVMVNAMMAWVGNEYRAAAIALTMREADCSK